MAGSILISDFDGTITDKDVYALIIETGVPDHWGEYGRGEITHFEAMRRIFSHAPTDEASLARLIEATRPDAGLAEAVEQLRRKDWDLAIVSAGSSWYIERILAAAGVRVPVHANPGHIEPGRGLVMELPPKGSPFYSAETGIDKPAVVRDALGRYRRVAFAGDGPPDADAAMLVPERLRFARGWLAREFTRKRIPFRSYRRWSEIAGSLS